MSDRTDIHELDNDVREKMRLLDKNQDNVFTSEYSLILNYTPYKGKWNKDKPARSPEDRIIYIQDGWESILFDNVPYELHAGTLAIVPKNTIITVIEQDLEYKPFCIVLHPKSIADSLGLASAQVHILSREERRIMDNVIDTVQRMVTLDGACIQTVKPLFDLIVELTQKVHPQDSEHNGTRAYAIMKDFRTRLRNPYSEKILSANEYAEHLHITANHLNSVMKQTTNRTTTD